MKRVFLIILFLVLLIPSGVNASQSVGEVKKKWDNVAVAVDTDWFSQDLGMVGRFSRPVKHTFQFSCPTATVINLQLKYNSITSVHNFNGGQAIGISNGAQYSVILHSGMTYNIQHKTATQACKVVITESFNVDL